MKNLRALRLRNYPVREEETVRCTILEAATATCAAPTFFDPVEIKDVGVTLHDGALKSNNPVEEIVSEIDAEFNEKPIHCVVSIGTGVSKDEGLGRSLVTVAKACIEIATDTEDTHYKLKERECREGGRLRKRYFRFNVDQGLQDVGLAEWEAMDNIWGITRTYMDRHKEETSECIQCLRQGQEAGTSAPERSPSTKNNRKSFPTKPVTSKNDTDWLSGKNTTNLIEEETDLRCSNLDNYGLSPVTYFCSREEIVQEIHQVFQKAKPSNTSICCLRGIGGSGKTQLALKYAETHYPRKYNTLLWFDANSPQRLSECFLFTAKILGIIAATTATSRSSAYKAVTKRWEADYVVAVKEWLKKRRGRYLLVFDNADTDEMIDLLPRFLPVTGQGHTLITSRRDRVYILGGIVLVEGLPPESAADLLLHHAGIEDPSGEQRALGLKVVSKMGYLALAIDLAGVFIRTLRGDIKKYDQMYAEAKDKVNQMALHESHNAAASSYPYSVFAAWDISRNALSPPAQDFLHLLSFFNRDYLNLDIFGRCCGTRVRWKVDGELQFRSPTDSGVSDWLLAAVTNNNGTFNQYKLLKIVSEICSFSFASTETVAGPRLYQYDQSQLFELGVKSETTTMAMHPLLHEIGRLYLDAEEQERFAEQAECILWHSIDDDANKPWRKSNQEYFPVLHIGGGATQNVPLFISQLDEVFRHLQSVMTLAFPDHDDIISDTGHLKSYYFCLLLLYLTRALNAKTVKEINTTYSIFTKHIWISRLDTELRRLGVLRRQDLTTQWLRLASRQCKLMLKSFSDDLSIPTMENYFYLWNYAVECELETYLKYLKTKAAKKGLTLEGMESEQTPEEAVNIVKKIQGSQLLEQIELGQQNLDYSTMTSAKQ